MRKKPNSQKMQSNTSAAMATPPSSAASPRRPIAAVATRPSSGVVRLASIAGPAIENTRALVIGLSREDAGKVIRHNTIAAGGIGDETSGWNSLNLVYKYHRCGELVRGYR